MNAQHTTENAGAVEARRPTRASSISDPVSYFDQYFEVVPANNFELQRAAYRLRFEVYCKQLRFPGFEPHRFPTAMETDCYDHRSKHCLLRHRDTGEWAGLVRLVLADPKDPDKPFPTEIQAASSLDERCLSDIDRREVGEISRLIVAPNFRKRRGEYVTPYGSADPRLPLPLLGLLAGAMRLSAENDVKYWLAVMEPHLNRLLRRLGLSLEPIGPAVSFCGTRYPCLGEVSAVLRSAGQTNPDAWSIITTIGTR